MDELHDRVNHEPYGFEHVTLHEEHDETNHVSADRLQDNGDRPKDLLMAKATAHADEPV